MKTHKLALIGFGTVGQGLCEILLTKSEMLTAKYGFEWEVVAVSDFMKGAVYSPDGLDVKTTAGARRGGHVARKVRRRPSKRGGTLSRRSANRNADIVCEMTYTDIKTGQPATDHCRAAFETGKHVVTSNKGPAALFYSELDELADEERRDVHDRGHRDVGYARASTSPTTRWRETKSPLSRASSTARPTSSSPTWKRGGPTKRSSLRRRSWAMPRPTRRPTSRDSTPWPR